MVIALVGFLLTMPRPGIAQGLDEAAVLTGRVIELTKQGHYSEAVAAAQRALAIREKALGPDHPDVATSLSTLALLYSDQGRYADAETLYKRSLAIWEKAFGPDYHNLATSLTNLARPCGRI